MTLQLPALHAYTHLTVVGSDGAYGGLVGFNYDNESGWLQIHANGPGVGAQGSAIEIVATGTAASDGGVYIANSGDGFLELHQQSGGQLLLQAEALSFGIELLSYAGITLLEQSATGITIQQGGGGNGPIAINQVGDGGFALTNSGTGQTVINQAGNAAIQIEQTASSGSSGIGLLTQNSSGKQITLHETTGGGIGITSDGGGSIGLSTHSNVIVFPSGATRPILLIAEPSGGSATTVGIGISSTDFVSIFDNNGFSSPVERFRFFADGHVEFLALPTSSAGLASGSLWNSAGTVKIV